MPDPAPNEGEYEAGELVEIVTDDEISHEERLKLWVAAGARCAFCKRYLLENEVTGDAVRIGEMAHIVGRSNKPRSPRGDDPLPGTARNKADNLVLVCPNEHTTIDKTSGVKIWKTDDLRRLKREHEDAIRTLTKMTRDRSTTVLRVAGSIRGSTPSITKELVHEAVHADLRFPQYRLGAVGSDLEVDLVTNLDETAPDYYARTDDVIERRIAQIADQIARGEVGHISLFALARIPVLVQLGHHLDDKWPVDVHPFDRRTGTWGWSESPGSDFSVTRTAGASGSDEVTLILSLSGTVNRRDLSPHLVDGPAVYEMSPINAAPSVTLFTSKEALARFTNAYLAFLADLEREHPTTAAIDVVPAIGLTAAIELGRRRTRSKHPTLRVWDQLSDGGGYFLATEVGR